MTSLPPGLPGPRVGARCCAVRPPRNHRGLEAGQGQRSLASAGDPRQHGGMTNEPTTPNDAVPGDVPADDDVPVEPEVHEELPDALDLPLEVPEADALEQAIDVPLDDDDR